MNIKIIDISMKKTLKEISVNMKEEIKNNKDLIYMAKLILGFKYAELFDFFLNAVEKSELTTVIMYVHENKFKDILDKIND